MDPENSAFQSVDLYPELQRPLQYWRAIKMEALKAQRAMRAVCDNRTENRAWKALPLLVEEEDQCVFSDKICKQGRRLLPQTFNWFRNIPTLQALALSSLEPSGRIKPHYHENPYVTAALCLQAKGNVWIRVNGEKRFFIPGETLIFDYQCIHEVFNDGPVDRIVLLVLLSNKMESLKCL